MIDLAEDKMQPFVKALLAGSVAMLCLIILKGPHPFIDWLTGNFLLYLAAFFFLWPVARGLTGQSVVTISSFVNVIIGFLAWIAYAFLNDVDLLLLVESFFTIVFIVGVLYATFSIIGEKLKWGAA